MQQSLDETEIVHIDNLLEEIEDNEDNFWYSLSDISLFIKNAFHSNVINELINKLE